MTDTTTLKELIDTLKLSSIRSIKFRKFTESTLIIEVVTDNDLHIARAVHYTELEKHPDVLNYMWENMMKELTDFERSRKIN